MIQSTGLVVNGITQKDTYLQICVTWEAYMKDTPNPIAIRSKKMITDTLFELLKASTYEEITVTEIIQNSGIARKTFYRNFESKDDILKTYLRGLINDYAAEWNERRLDSVAVIFEFVEDYKDTLLTLSRNNLLPLLLICLNEYLPAAHSKASGDEDIYRHFFGELDPKYLLAFNIGAIWNTLFVWIKGGMKEPVYEIKELLQKYFSMFQRPDT